MKSRKAQRAQTESCNRYAGFNPAVVVGADKAEAEVDCVAGLHAHEGAPDEDGGTVEKTSDYVAEEEEEIAMARIEGLFEVCR
ncbi:Bicupin oxalate decarboxylase/oxidase [Penicillium manginii]|jgi:hypothetical protein|uniref:Bicupin oxalate decarboxylase/oxidase n=1 Tax=Penicillium manginii TaxID=203109 RepID=UPI0025491101|nr:Bicupin oxalate decarboxylase/oxidase [Penicillium manginii]KAJ5762671.1 Bicupin oxalate decarboxylase/oxidase [Penicillium manginii]